MQHKVELYIQEHELLTHDRAVIVGVSGGTDSVVLLHILISLGYNCIIAHCNFHLRMEESNRDEQFVRALAKQLKTPIYCIDFETIKYAESNKISIEMAARDLRYNWFEELRIKHNAQAVAVAHHADDNIETLLLNLIRGTGIRGMKGMPNRNKNVVRPLLFLPRESLNDYMMLHHLHHVEDSSNAMIDYKRNKIRNEVLPILAKMNPAIRETLYNTQKRLEGNLIIYQQAIENIKKIIVHKSDDSIKMDIDLILEQADVPTIMYELLYPYNFSPSTIEQITEQLNAESGKVFHSETHRLIKDRRCLIIKVKGAEKEFEFIISQDENEIKVPFSMTIKKQLVDENFKVSKACSKIHVDASKLTYPLQIRRWMEGDSFIPFGMNQHKKLSDFFIDNKLSLFEKEQIWLLVSDNKIVWVMGKRIDDRFKVTNETLSVIEFKISD